MHNNAFLHQLALKADRSILEAEEVDYLRLDIPAHEHLTYAGLILKASPWRNVKRFVLATLLIYAFLFSLTNAAAYTKIAVASLTDWQAAREVATQETLVQPESSIQATHAEAQPALLVPTPSNFNPSIDSLAAYLPTPASTNDRIVIPSLKVNAPVVEPTLGLDALESKDFEVLEDQIHDALLRGVVHFPGTAEPGQNGNVFLTGHSSNVFWERSDYNSVFALLPKIEIGADIYVTHNLTEYHYKVTEKKEVKPTDITALKQGESPTLTVVTCTPVGTTYRRLVVTAELVQS